MSYPSNYSPWQLYFQRQFNQWHLLEGGGVYIQLCISTQIFFLFPFFLSSFNHLIHYMKFSILPKLSHMLIYDHWLCLYVLGVFCFVLFCFCCVKIPDKGNLRRKALLWCTIWDYRPSWQEGMVTGSWGTWSQDNTNQETKRDECWGSDHFLLFILTRTPAQGVVWLTFRVGLLTSVNLI